MPTPPTTSARWNADVAIAGGSLAGGALAILLARAGANVLVLEGSTFPRDKLCGEFLSPECWDVLERLGVREAVSVSGYHPVRRVRLTTPRGRVIEAEIAGATDPSGIGLSRSKLDEIVLGRARENGAQVLEGTRVSGPIVCQGRVVGFSARHPSLGVVAVSANVVVAANGRHSAIVQQTGLTRVRSRFRPRYFGLKRHVRLNEAIAPEPEETVGLHLLRGGYAGTCRIEGELTNLCALLPESWLRPCRGNLDRLVSGVFPRNPHLGRFWESARPVGEWKTVSGVRVEASSARLPGIFYAGDCRGTVDPLGGQGMTMALLGAELLAPFVLDALTQKAAGRRVQRAYESTWERRFARRIRLCRAFHHLLVSPAALDVAAHYPAVAARVLRMSYRQTRDVQRAAVS